MSIEKVLTNSCAHKYQDPIYILECYQLLQREDGNLLNFGSEGFVKYTQTTPHESQPKHPFARSSGG